jgi:anti-sigma factor RsiW
MNLLGMDNEKLEMLLIDYIDGKLTEAERQQVDEELVRNEKAFRLYEQLKEVIHAIDKSKKLEPSHHLKKQFDEFLAAEVKASKKETKVIFFQPAFYRAAAAVALLVVGGGIGFWISKHNTQRQQIDAIAKELATTKALMMGLIENQQSASQRLQGVNVALTIANADDEVVKALAMRINEDANTNVRLAALDALSKFHTEPQVRKVLLEALSTQKDPVVQIALIQLMVKIKEKSIVNDLKKIVEDNESMKAVKDEAYSGILKLS